MVRHDALPTWANTGFSDPTGGGIPWVPGASGKIVAIEFVQLSAPEAKDHANKVLWVSRVPSTSATPLKILGTLDGTSQQYGMTVESGPGPSYVNMPRAGCWHLALSWDEGRQTDSLDLVFSKP